MIQSHPVPAPERADQVDALLARLVRGEAAAMPAEWRAVDAAQFVERAIYHGVAGMIAGRLVPGEFPPTVGAAIEARARAFAMWHVRHHALLRALDAELAARSTEAYLLKGSALAYDLYPNPAWRERGDSDLLVRRSDRDRARECLACLGFELQEGDGVAERFTYQESWLLRPADGTRHEVDLHFTPMNIPAYADRIGVDDASRGSRPLDAIGQAIRLPSRPFLLLHACLHRRSHECAPYLSGARSYLGGNRLIWLMDIDLLARDMDPAQWADFVALAADKRESADCLAGLAAAADALGTPLPNAPLEFLAADAPRSSGYFDSGKLGRYWRDVAAIAGTGAKARYLLGRLFPSASFMRARYPEARRRALGLLYARRMIELAAHRRPSD